MKNEIQKATSLNTWNQKLLVNGQLLKVTDDYFLCNMKLPQDRQMILLTKNELLESDYKKEGFRDESE